MILGVFKNPQTKESGVFVAQLFDKNNEHQTCNLGVGSRWSISMIEGEFWYCTNITTAKKTPLLYSFMHKDEKYSFSTTIRNMVNPPTHAYVSSKGNYIASEQRLDHPVASFYWLGSSLPKGIPSFYRKEEIARSTFSEEKYAGEDQKALLIWLNYAKKYSANSLKYTTEKPN